MLADASGIRATRKPTGGNGLAGTWALAVPENADSATRATVIDLSTMRRETDGKSLRPQGATCGLIRNDSRMCLTGAGAGD
jgi:hypothetical protein